MESGLERWIPKVIEIHQDPLGQWRKAVTDDTGAPEDKMASFAGRFCENSSNLLALLAVSLINSRKERAMKKSSVNVLQLSPWPRCWRRLWPDSLRSQQLGDGEGNEDRLSGHSVSFHRESNGCSGDAVTDLCATTVTPINRSTAPAAWQTIYDYSGGAASSGADRCRRQMDRSDGAHGPIGNYLRLSRSSRAIAGRPGIEDCLYFQSARLPIIRRG